MSDGKKWKRTSAQAELPITGVMPQRIAAFDWAQTPLGPQKDWTQSLKTAVSIMLSSRYAMWMAWGPELTFLYNDAYLPTLGIKQEWALGAPAHQVWKEIWPDIGPRIDTVLTNGRATWDEGLMLILERSGFAEETFHTFSYSPLTDNDGTVAGMLCVVTEETQRKLNERRLALLNELAAAIRSPKSETVLYSAIQAVLNDNRQDIAFSWLYIFDADYRARLMSSSGPYASEDIAPGFIESSDTLWFANVMREQPRPILVEDIQTRFGQHVPPGVWSKPVEKAYVIPIMQAGQAQAAGFMIMGLNPYRPLDADYQGFIDLLSGQIAAAITGARAYEEANKRAEMLAELDKAKTVFFSNISHEFRTPLTLMLGPLEDIRNESTPDSASHARIEVAHRNALRLLKLVNTLLDFSRIEAGRTQAAYVKTDLVSLTAELASNFRSATDKAGLRLEGESTLEEPVYVDPVMWEKIVLNLLSNAFKYTFEGTLRVTLQEEDDYAVLRVADTGTGIPPQDLPHLFKRFHRVEGARGRTYEGSGIGLALVQELVLLHGGDVHAESELGKGSTFTVRIPLGKSHLPADSIKSKDDMLPAGIQAEAFVEEALRWLPDNPAFPHPPEEAAALQPTAGARILLADDNADMRDYLKRLLEVQYHVEAVANGEEAWKVLERQPVDLVLTDVMMPQLDGFGLLARLRQHEALKHIPVVMLSARAGEEAMLEGVEAGADDYLVKPFSSRELMARINAAIRFSRQRQQWSEALRERENRLRIATDAAALGVFEWDIVKDEVIWESERIYDIFGVSSHTQAINKANFIRDFLHEEDKEDFERALRQGLQPGSNHHVVCRFRRPDGELRWIEVHGLCEFDCAGIPTRMIGVVGDITEEKKIRLALEESESRFRRMANTAPAILWITDKTGHCTFLSRNWCELTGQTEEEALAYGWLKAAHPDDMAYSKEIFMQALKEQKAFQIDYRLRKIDGEYAWIINAGRPFFSENGEFHGFIGSVFDITDRKSAELDRERLLGELREQEARFRRIADTNIERLGIVFWKANGELTQVNDAFQHGRLYAG
jgi:PAS domain S-box-containing protein